MDKAPELTDEQAWAGYRKYKDAFKAAGIPWNKKGSPHRLLLKAKWYLRQVPFHKVISFTIQHYTPRLIENLTRNNALRSHLKKNGQAKT